MANITFLQTTAVTLRGKHSPHSYGSIVLPALSFINTVTCCTEQHLKSWKKAGKATVVHSWIDNN